jgi:hypothetical protein
MKIIARFCLTVSLALPQIAPAAPPLTPQAIGQVEATVDFCVKADAKSADKYKELGKSQVAGLSEKDLAEIRDSDDYKAMFKLTTTLLQKAPSDRAAEGCREMLKNSTTKDSSTKDSSK